MSVTATTRSSPASSVAVGAKVCAPTRVVHDLEVGGQTISTCIVQEQVDLGQAAALNSDEESQSVSDGLVLTPVAISATV